MKAGQTSASDLSRRRAGMGAAGAWEGDPASLARGLPRRRGCDELVRPCPTPLVPERSASMSPSADRRSPVTASFVAALALALTRTAVAEAWPLPDWSTVTPAEAGLDEALLQQARDYALTGG